MHVRPVSLTGRIILTVAYDRTMYRIFLFVGLVCNLQCKVVSVPFVYWKLDNGVTSARFLTPRERVLAVERLRANQTGIGSRRFEWALCGKS